MSNTLYRAFDADGNLLYVGATTTLAIRLGHHASRSPWWDEASRITLQRFDTAEQLAMAEIEAIKSEQPRYNVIHTDKPRLSLLKPRQSYGGGTIFQRTDGVWIGAIELPPENGRRRRRTVSSKDRATVERRMAELVRRLDG